MTLRSVKKEQLIGQSTAAKKFWGKGVEDALPSPTITEDIEHLTPSLMLMDILRYARGAESRGEWLFRKNYLHPMLNHFSTINEATSWKEDEMGNMYVQVGELNGVLHVGHIDTVHDNNHSPLQEIEIDATGIVTLKPIVKESLPAIKKGDRWIKGVKSDYHYVNYELPPKIKRCLGADDGCAVATMLYLIANQVSGTYLFTRGEEIGCVGTHYIIDNSLIKWEDYMIAIEVDRKGTQEIIGNMSVGVTASQSFVSSLAKQLDMGHVMGRGTITDVGHISGFIPECVNISAGYNLQHSEKETTDLVYLDKLGKALLTVNWDELVIERKAGAFTSTVKQPYKYNNNVHQPMGGYQGYQTTPRNSYGDYTVEPEKLTKPFKDIVANMNMMQIENLVRSNSGFLAEFLSVLTLSPAEIHSIICFGDLDSIEDETDDTTKTKD